MTLTLFITYLSAYSVGIPLIVGIINFKRLSPTIRWIVYYIAVSSTFSFVISYAALSNIITYSLTSANIFIEALFILYIYYRVLTPFFQRWIFMAVGIGFVSLFGILWIVADDPILKLTILWPTESVLVIVLCLLYFLKVSRELMIINLAETTLFWVSTAFLLYFSIELFFFILQGPISVLSEEAQNTISAIFNQPIIVIANLLIALGLWQKQPG